MKLLKVLILISIILLLLFLRNFYKLYKSFQLDKKYRTSIENYKSENGKYPNDVKKLLYSVYNNNKDYKIFISEDNGLFYEVYLYCSDGAEEKCKEDCKYKLSTRYGKWYHYHQYD